MAASSNSSCDSELQDLRVAVEELYSFRDTFFQRHPLEAAGQKGALLDAKLQEVLKLLRAKEGALKGAASRPSLLYLEGKALNVLSEPSVRAEEVLSQAVKLSPGLADAWNQLGECYWKQERVEEAKDCFLGALQHCRDKVTLRSLSMVVRHAAPSAAQQTDNAKQSVKYAEQAVHLDVTDGQSWAALGNAYMSLFFSGGQDAGSLQKARSSYTNAEKDGRAYYSSDLHYNKATLCKYLEEFGTALAGYRLSAALDPGWGAPGEQADALARHLQLFHQLIKDKGKVKRKQMASYLSKLAQQSPAEEGCDLATLRGSGDSSGRSLLVVIVAQLASTDQVPLCIVAVDCREEPVGVTLYNLADGRGPLIGDVLCVAGPRLHQVQLEDPRVAFECVTVRNPINIAINGKPLPRSCMAPTVMNVASLH